MMGLGTVMIVIYLHVYFVPYQRLQTAVADSDFKAGGEQLGKIRRWVGTNLLIGLLVAVAASAGRYLGA
jgi:uncharacterized membrane protein